MTARESILRYDRALDCVHCGLCLPVCPTYRLTGRESASPRGRIYLMRAFAEGRLQETADSIQEIDRCLVCRACEPVCPSGVQFGEMMEITRDLVEATPARGRLHHHVKRWFFRKVLGHPARLRMLAEGLRLFQKSGLRWVARQLGLLHLVGRDTVLRDAMMPVVPPMAERSEPSAVTRAQGETTARVGFLVGCVAHELLPGANRAAIRSLARAGCEVHCPPERPCCGALPLHFGDLEAARDLARRTIAAFEAGGADGDVSPVAGPVAGPDGADGTGDSRHGTGSPELDAIVVSSAGCASAMKDYGRLLEDDEEWRERAARFARRVQDFSEFLVQRPVAPPEHSRPLRVAFDAPCHLLHAQRIADPPRALIAALPGVELVDFQGQDDCCGAAGLYTVTNPGQSVDLLRHKIEAVKAADVDVLVTANPGCQLQLMSGVREWAPRVEVLHLAELIERAYRYQPPEEPEEQDENDGAPDAAPPDRAARTAQGGA